MTITINNLDNQFNVSREVEQGTPDIVPCQTLQEAFEQISLWFKEDAQP